jgi:hypothetical protein
VVVPLVKSWRCYHWVVGGGGFAGYTELAVVASAIPSVLLTVVGLSVVTWGTVAGIDDAVIGYADGGWYRRGYHWVVGGGGFAVILSWLSSPVRFHLYY